MTAVDTKGWVDEPEPVEQDDFLTFWRIRQAAAAPETKRILGVDVVVPTDIPVRLQIMAAEMGDTQDPDALRPFLVDIFGADHFDTWIAHGLTVHMMKVILAWGVTNGSGTPCTFERAVELAAEMEAAAAEGKAPPVSNRADRRASSGTGKSASTGLSSSRTSAASTTSRRRKSAS